MNLLLLIILLILVFGGAPVFQGGPLLHHGYGWTPSTVLLLVVLNRRFRLRRGEL